MLEFSFYNVAEPKILECKDFDLYAYRVYLGKHRVPVSKYNSYWYISGDTVVSETGSQDIESETLCVEIFGYRPETRTSSFSRYTDLPYINGCSTKQLINANRLGDPTWQMLLIPPWTSEQQHHIHSTVRIVYVVSGRGKSHVGASGKSEVYDLTPGMVVVLDKMIPHHFSTEDESLVVLPLHIFSSTHLEHNHPMFNGTHKTE